MRDPTDIHVNDLHSHTNVLMLEHGRYLYLLTEIYNNIQLSKFDLKNHGVNTRHNDGMTIELPIPRTEHLRDTAVYKGKLIWNNLNLNIRSAENKKLFKKLVREGLTSEQIQTEFPMYCL